MREGFSVDAVNAIVNSSSYKLGVRLSIYKSRAYFEDYSDQAPSYSKDVAYTGNPLPESSTYIPSIDKVVTVVIDDTGKVAMLVEGDNTSIQITSGGNPLVADPGSRPGIFCDEANTGNNYIYWHDGSVWIATAFDKDLLVAEDPECIVNQYQYADLGIGAIYPIGRDESVILSFYEGSIRVSYIDTDRDIHNSVSRIINPIVVLDPGSSPDDAYLVHYGGVARIEDIVYVYLTHYDGSVKTIRYFISGNGKDGSWSDITTAIPKDLSDFQVGNVFNVENRIFICGRFVRQEEFSASSIWTFLTWSDDGETFTLDRRVLVTGVDLRFFAIFCQATNELVFSSTNRSYRQVAPYQLIGEDTTSIVVTLVSVKGGPSSEFSCELASGQEQYFNVPIVDTGSYCSLHIGVFTGLDFEWATYHDAVISSVSKTIRDGARGFTLGVVPDGPWHTSSMPYPLYMEFQGRQSIFDPCTDFSNLYRVSTGIGPTWSLSCDFWTADNLSAFQVQTHSAQDINEGSTDWWAADLLSFCKEYPSFGTDETYTFRIFGWSRAGKPDQNPNVADDTPTDSLNDRFYGLIKVEYEDGGQDVLVLDDLSSSFSYPRQTWFPGEVHTGSYPVVYSLDNPGEGVKILQIGARVIAPDNDTTYYLERVEMKAISVELIPSGIDQPFFQKDTGDHRFTLISQSTAEEADTIGAKYQNIVFHQTEEETNPFYISFIKVKNEDTIPMIISVDISTTFQANPPTESVRIMILKNDIVLFSMYGDGSLEEQSVSLSRNITLAAGDTCEASVNSYVFDAGGFETLDVTFAITVLDTVTDEQGLSSSGLINKKKGIPQVVFSSKPYSAFNFESEMRVSVRGKYSVVGLVGLANDEKNFVYGYIKAGETASTGSVSISVIRNGRRRELASTGLQNIRYDAVYDLRFWHRDGVFGVEWKQKNEDWPNRGSILVYEWTLDDGSLAPRDDVFHVGFYSFIDSPRFRITGFNSGQAVLGVMPIDLDDTGLNSDFMTLFPESGRFDIDGIVYKYTGKSVSFTNSGSSWIGGPFQLRNITDWKDPFNKDPDGSHSYAGSRAIEFTQFNWWAGDTHAADYYNAIIGSSAGYAWINSETMWKAWITTGKVLVYLRNRSRHYSSGIPDYFASGNEKIWVTNGLTGISKVDSTKDEYYHSAGTFCYLHSTDFVKVLGFSSSSGDPDQNIASLLKVFCELSGTRADFPGDFTQVSQTLNDGESLELQ